MATDATLPLAFLAGLLSFLSPCCLPVYPSYLSYISGVSFDELKTGAPAVRRRALRHALAFVLGFSSVFVALGASSSLLGTLFIGYREIVQRVGGLLIVAMGLFLLGLLPRRFLQREWRLPWAGRPSGYIGSALAGLAFAAGWTPCIGPILASVLVLAAANPAAGLRLLGAYAAGFAVPFLALAYAVGSVRFLRRYAPLTERVSGGVLVAMGILLFSGEMSRVTAWFITLYGGWIGF
ncbi:MAG: cytochrome c biogenesis protein CcdA [Clostridia bacterium]|nr:cytochrome c biogenesis protein CcdA [Clostridia bacterium]